MNLSIALKEIDNLQSWKQHLLALIIIALIIFVYFFPVLAKGEVFVTTGLIHSDLMSFSYPLKHFYAQNLKAGQIPLWVLGVGAGFPVAAESQLGAFYPLNILIFGLLPMPFAFNFSLAFHLFLACFFTYLLAKEAFSLSFFAGLFAGIAYGLGGFFAAHFSHLSMVQVAAFFPLIFLLVLQLVEKRNLKTFLILSLIYSLVFLAGHLQILYYFQVVLGFFVLSLLIFSYQEKRLGDKLVFLANWVGSLVLAFLVSGVQFLISFEFIKNSERGLGLAFSRAVAYTFPFSHLLHFILPGKADFSKPVFYGQHVETISAWETFGFIGVSTLVLVLIGIVFSRHRKRVCALLFLVVLSFVFCLGRTTPFFEIFWRIVPFMKIFQHPTRLMSVVNLGLALLAGFGLDTLLSFDFPSLWENLLPFALVFLLLGELFTFNKPVNQWVLAEQWFEMPSSARYLKGKLSPSYRFFTFGANSYNFRLIDDLSVQFGLRNLLPPNYNLVHSLPSVNRHFGIALRRGTKFFHRWAYFLGWHYNSQKVVVNPIFDRFLDLTSANYVLSGLELASDNLVLEKVWEFEKTLPYELELLGFAGEKNWEEVQSSGVYLYENLDALPRASFVSEIIEAQSAEEALNLLEDENFDPRKNVILETDANGRKFGEDQRRVDANADNADSADEVGEGVAEIVVDGDQEVVVEV
ncbi:MAG: hypothetical protein U9M98_03505, partial [Patescibacteria group bacterium]|nr:hypothetical protein [Patescibacteria group bacterium]